MPKIADYSRHSEQMEYDKALLSQYKKELTALEEEKLDLEIKLDESNDNKIKLAGRLSVILQEIQQLEETIVVLETRLYSSRQAHYQAQARLRYLPSNSLIQ
jgi:chromosome segregation ATPase